MTMRQESNGFSMVELLVGLTVGGLVAAAALTVTLSSRRMYDGDRSRTDLNQSLRTGVDLLGAELRQAGERLPGDFPAVEIVDGGGGADTLILRRNLLDAVLPICAQIDAGTTVDVLPVADSGGSPPIGCTPLVDTDADGWPDNIDEWRDFRDANGGSVAIYLFNPVSGFGEFVNFDVDDVDNDNLGVSAAGLWQGTYLVADQCRVYVLEQRQFELSGELLRFVENANPVGAENLVNHLVDFQVRAVLTDGTLMDTFDSTDDWSDLRSIEVTLTGETTVGGRVLRRSMTSRFLPRNVLSL